MDKYLKNDVHILWLDFLANAKRLSSKKEQERMVKNAARAGITHLVVDAKIPYGHTTFPSQYAYHVSDWSDGRFNVWEHRDFLNEIIQEAKGSGLQVIANMDVFAEGISNSTDGMVYDHEDWKIESYNDATAKKAVAQENSQDRTVFVNPIHPEVINYETNILQEIITQYSIDGIVLDRCRYPNIYGDFGRLSREKFEDYIDEKINQWPMDIFEIDEKTGTIIYAKYFKKWTEWRAFNIKKFVQKAKKIVKSTNPEMIFCIYVGSWYPLYFNEGVNWGSSSYQPNLEWVSDQYHQTGYADELDFIMTGCYYPEVRIEDAMKNKRPAPWYSVEGAIDMSLEAINKRIPVLPSLYIKDYQNNPDQFKKAIQICKKKMTGGVMFFDVSFLEEYQWWDKLAFGLREY